MASNSFFCLSIFLPIKAPVPAPTAPPTAAPMAAPLPLPTKAPIPAPSAAPPPAPIAAPLPVLLMDAHPEKIMLPLNTKIVSRLVFFIVIVLFLNLDCKSLL